MGDRTKKEANDLTGVWMRVGGINDAGQVEKANTSTRALKFIANGRWSLTHHDTKSGIVKIHHGGTYTIGGDEYS